MRFWDCFTSRPSPSQKMRLVLSPSVTVSVVESPAVVDTAVHAAPLLHHVLPHVAHVAPVPVVARNPHVIKPFVQF